MKLKKRHYICTAEYCQEKISVKQEANNERLKSRTAFPIKIAFLLQKKTKKNNKVQNCLTAATFVPVI